MLPRQCRYHPSCSAYALQAYEAYPLWQATVLTLKRIGRCHPWHPGGYDPLPEPACGLKDACPAEHSADTPT
ncbi:MAG: membrane protein insertion efficiency factor YidD [Pseudomonadota bacterium]